MKTLRLIIFVFTVMLATATMCAAVYANGKIDTSRASDGLVTFEFSGDLKATQIRLWIQLKGEDQSNPHMNVNPTTYPLNRGTGAYDLKIMEVMPDNKGKVVEQTSVTLHNEPDEKIMFTASNIDVDFDKSVVAIPEYKIFTEGLSDNAAIDKLYEEVVNAYGYDHDRAKAVVNSTLKGYRPVIDDVYREKKGICFDYSAMLAGTLRSRGVPVKLVKGYAADLGEYHAWNEVLVDGTWVVVDTTFDSAYAHAGQPYTFAKDPDKYQATGYF